LAGVIPVIVLSCSTWWHAVSTIARSGLVNERIITSVQARSVPVIVFANRARISVSKLLVAIITLALDSFSEGELTVCNTSIVGIKVLSEWAGKSTKLLATFGSWD